jgi:hypothetical protein
MVTPFLRCCPGRKSLFTKSSQFTLDFVSPFSYTYEVLLPYLADEGYGVNGVVGRRSL